MKIAYVITRSDAIGGAHIHVRDLAMRLKQAGHDPVVLVGGDGPFIRELVERQIPHRSVPNLVRAIRPLDDFTALIQLRRELATLKPDLVSTHSSKAGLLGRLAAKSLGIPVIFTAHGWAFTDGVDKRQRRLYLMAERWAARFSDRIITVSDYDRTLALDYGVGSEAQLTAIHNGMPDVRAEYLADPAAEPPRIVMVARFEEQKDHGTLLTALAPLQDVPWTLELVGDGPLRPKIEKLARDLGLEKRIDFSGAVNDVGRRLANAQIFALISRWEGFPRSILEAMRAGLPVIASDVGGVRESVADGINGYLVPRGDTDAARDALQRLLLQPDTRADMGAKGRTRFETEFAFDMMFEKTIGVYREVLARKEA